MVDNLPQNTYTRREFLEGAAAGTGALLALGGIGQIAGPIADQAVASLKSCFSNEVFLYLNQSRLNQLKIGGSFSPEQVYYLNGDARANPKETLKVIVEGLDIRDLRLGIRWSQTMDQEDKVSIADYEPYINYCLNNDVNLCLNVGPIKTFRWPEQHIPFFIKEKGLPPKNSLITPDMEIAKRAENYLGLLLSRLKSTYGNALAPTIQLENESRINFGELGYTMSNDYIHRLVSLSQQFFPDSKFLFNTGPFVVEPIEELLKRLHGDSVKTVYGVDYYYNIDDYTNSNNWLIQLPLIGNLDLLTLSKMFGKPIIPSGLHNLDIEVTEGQFEGWGRYFKPGNSAKDFRYLLYRCIKDIFGNDSTNNMLVRLWGLEAFAQKIMNKSLTEDHNQIIQLILAINQS